SVTYVAFLPELVTKSRVSEGNARLMSTAGATYVFGPALAGFATQAWGPEKAIGVDALSFLVSFMFLLFVKGARATAPAAGGSSGSLAVGLKFLFATPVLRAMALVVWVETLLTAAALDLFTFHLKSTLGQTDARVGTMFAVASVGAVLGAVLSSYA